MDLRGIALGPAALDHSEFDAAARVTAPRGAFELEVPLVVGRGRADRGADRVVRHAPPRPQPVPSIQRAVCD
jgi:hypothetical protein